MMKIVYDNIIFSWQKFGGISVVWQKLLSRILEKPADIQIIEYEGAGEHNIPRQHLTIPESMITSLGNSLFKIRRYQNPSPSLVKGNEKFIFHSSYYRVMKHPLAVNITTVHDFSYEFYEDNPLAKLIHTWQKHRSIRRSDYIICISENTRKDLQTLLPDIPAEKIRVIYNGIDAKYYRMADAHVQDYALYVGKRTKYKNFNALIEPLSQLNMRLKIVGPPLDKKEKRIMDDKGLQYDYCGIASESELNRLYNEAFCLLYTSLYEGFGLPVLEAQQAGCPVIAMNASSIPEVIGDKRLLIDTISKESLGEKFSLLKDPAQREDIIACGIENVKRFSWDKMADQYYELYAHALNTKQQ